ncbi:unnamed protein product, partial [Cyprideis torosa]
QYLKTSLAEALRDFRAWLRRKSGRFKILVAHNADFDARVLKENARRANVDFRRDIQGFACTYKIFKNKPGYSKGNCSLSELYLNAGGCPSAVELHSAEGDIKALKFVVQKSGITKMDYLKYTTVFL